MLSAAFLRQRKIDGLGSFGGDMDSMYMKEV